MRSDWILESPLELFSWSRLVELDLKRSTLTLARGQYAFAATRTRPVAGATTSDVQDVLALDFVR